MPASGPAEPEVFSIREVARAAGVLEQHARALLAASGVRAAPGGYLLLDDAARLVRTARNLDWTPGRLGLMAAAPGSVSRRGLPLMLSGAVHALVLVVVAAIAGSGGGTAAPMERVQEPPRLVFLVAPGPGGGGGGGGLRQPRPAPPARLHGRSPVSSPVALARNVESRRIEPPVAATPPAPVQAPPPDLDPPMPPPAAAPPVTAPVVSMAGDDQDEVGELVAADAGLASRGPGEGNGVGTGRGTGTGAGEGAGIGDGSGGGTGGGPYRPGSGITPPALEREVKPLYTEEARRRGIEGDVLLEVVVRSDGTVGSMRILRSLDAGLDQRAVDAVRQWRFSPARRLGTPVDVLVEVAVTFRLR